MKKNIKTVKAIKKPKTKKDWLKTTMISLAVLAHVFVIVLVILSNRYYGLEFKTFLGIIGALACAIIITDIVFYVAIKYRDVRIKIVNIVLSVLLLIIGAGGTYYVTRINKAVDNAIENEGSEQYETVKGTFVYYTKSGSGKTYSSLDDLKSASGLKIGVISDDGNGVGSIAQKILTENGVSATIKTYTSAEDLLAGLVGNEEDENIDVAVFQSAYRTRFSSDSELGDAYADYLDNMVDFYSFEEKVQVGNNETANKDLTVEPFNILLIGFAPEDEDNTVGLYDSIIVATVNPETFTVSMTSIARDTYVELTCARGSRQKINAAGSKQCLMDTVGELLDLEIDYYMQVNFTAVVDIVDAIGGIVVDNPVEFVGQTASGVRGEYTVLVPAGEDVFLDGEGALAFARERKHYADGDFQRQKNQQMVISRIAEKLLSMSSVNQALAVMEAAGENMSTNLSLNQLTNIFNYLVNHKNSTGVSTYNMIDIQGLRLTGYASWYYSYSMRLPQWIYRLYNGSIAETKERINDVLGNYTTNNIKQASYFKFFAEYPYSRGQLYSETFNEAQETEEMPAYYGYLTKMTYSEVLAWASANGVTLNVVFIDNASSEYVASRDGEVISQSVKYGALVSEYPSCTITVMGNQDANYDPEYEITCTDESSCKAFATGKGLTVTTGSVYDADKSEGSFAYAASGSGDKTKVKKSEGLVLYYYTKVKTVALPAYTGVAYSNYVSSLTNLGISSSNITVDTSNLVTNTDSSLNGTVADVLVDGLSTGAGTAIKTTSKITIKVYENATEHVHSYTDWDYNCETGKKTPKCPTDGALDTANAVDMTSDEKSSHSCTVEHTHEWTNNGDPYTKCDGTSLITYQDQRCSCGQKQTIVVSTEENSANCPIAEE